ncbi:MAG: response regulator [Spirochaetales bacterium]|nr:response regulator [Spirochaetales bacterium]
MKASGALFSGEEAVIRECTAILKEKKSEKTIRREAYETLFRHYEKLYKKMKRLVSLSDGQQAALQKSNETITAQRESLKRLDREKTDFFINLAHEIKTPLTLIKNYLNKYISEKGPDGDLDLVRRNFEKLIRDIVNVMDFEKVEGGGPLYDHSPIINLSDLVNMKTALFIELARGKNISMTADITEGLYVQMDPAAAERIINNLVENAIKYTDPGGSIRVSLWGKENDVLFGVRDTGTGIPKDCLDTIFRPYYQLSHRKRSSRGIGMGLNIVKKITEEAGGDITVQSKEGKGSEFVIRLPGQPPSPDAVETGPLERDIHARFRKKPKAATESIVKGRRTLLIVEDNADLLSFLAERLGETYNVFCASNGRAAMEKLSRIARPDLILSDIMMDEMDGYALYEALKRKPAFKAVPFIFITARTSQREKIEAIARGAVDYINKPFDIEELAAKISALIGLAEAKKHESESAVEKRIIDAIRHGKNEEDERYRFEENCRRFGLTAREKEIALLLLEGKEDKEAAYAMHISYNTERTHVKHIYEKCGVQNKVELVNLLKGRG